MTLCILCVTLQVQLDMAGTISRAHIEVGGESEASFVNGSVTNTTTHQQMCNSELGIFITVH